ncbi:MAG TPA: alpha/beta hydrolase [Anaerolineales bacterium]|nr:alpha/beta hydrolase [Anaerolineales bacterium]HRQ92625.1 alpha/beta hydrolase [Anaerolineales bacterium]
MMRDEYRRLPVFHFDFHPLVMWFMNLSVGVQRFFAGVGRKRTITHRWVEFTSDAGRRVKVLLLGADTMPAAAPLLLYFHGGAFALSYSSGHIRRCEQYALQAGYTVALVDYVLAPQHPFPAAFDECFAALKWVHEHADTLGVDPQRIVVGGDSAGGALAAGVAQKAVDQGMAVRGQLLIYPVLDDRCNTDSAVEFDDVPLWTATSNRRMWAMYLRDTKGEIPAYAAPARRERLRGLAPAYMETAQFDPLRDEGLAYAQSLRAAGIEVMQVHSQGTVHGFDLVSENDETQKVLAARIRFLLACVSE